MVSILAICVETARYRVPWRGRVDADRGAHEPALGHGPAQQAEGPPPPGIDTFASSVAQRAPFVRPALAPSCTCVFAAALRILRHQSLPCSDTSRPTQLSWAASVLSRSLPTSLRWYMEAAEQSVGVVWPVVRVCQTRCSTTAQESHVLCQSIRCVDCVLPVHWL